MLIFDSRFIEDTETRRLCADGIRAGDGGRIAPIDVAMERVRSDLRLVAEEQKVLLQRVEAITRVTHTTWQSRVLD